ncbi:MAG: RlmE family RNA methyltransferase [Hyphomicrobiaceae bacterium]|nr:RlmE family RNA methyltransferase [Hyphomicrobiaceae bacterium]
MVKGSKTGMGGAKGARDLSVRVKSARGRKPSSTRWLQRQLNDPYVAAAKREGYRSRAAYKLVEMDDKLHFLKPGRVVVDLGAAPGGWSQVASKRIRTEYGGGHLVAIDINEMEVVAGAHFLQCDFHDDKAPEQIRALIGERPVDVVLSDMAEPATGHRQTDHLRIMALCELALDFAREILAPNGVFVAKVLAGGTEHTLLADMKRDFTKVKHVKPKASRADSAEMYVVASGYRGGE